MNETISQFFAACHPFGLPLLTCSIIMLAAIIYHLLYARRHKCLDRLELVSIGITSAEAGTYEVRFIPTGGKHHARISRVELLDGDTSLSADDRHITLSSPASYFVTAPAAVKNPRIRITFDNGEKERDTRGNITITRK